jgi:hypothetical protein
MNIHPAELSQLCEEIWRTLADGVDAPVILLPQHRWAALLFHDILFDMADTHARPLLKKLVYDVELLYSSLDTDERREQFRAMQLHRDIMTRWQTRYGSKFIAMQDLPAAKS